MNSFKIDGVMTKKGPVYNSNGHVGMFYIKLKRKGPKRVKIYFDPYGQIKYNDLQVGDEVEINGFIAIEQNKVILTALKLTVLVSTQRIEEGQA